jgi:DNA invertase Pin-like site-specific DNA recombinase
LLVALEEFRSLGIQFVSYQENIDTSSPLGQALFTIVAPVAQLERDLIRERVSAGIRHAQANGKTFGRPKRLVGREQILKLKAEGRSLRQIAAFAVVDSFATGALVLGGSCSDQSQAIPIPNTAAWKKASGRSRK